MTVQLGRLEEAFKDAEASLLLVSTPFKALRTRARINFRLEKYEASISDWKRAIAQPDADANVNALEAELKQAEAALRRSMRKDYYYKILGEFSLVG